MAANNDNKPRMGKVVAKASANPVNLGVGAAAATLAIGLGSVPLAALGALAYGAMVAFDSFNPTFWKKVYGGAPAPPPPKLPPPESVKDPETRDAITRIRAARRDIEKVVGETPADVLVQLAGTLASLDALEGHAARLVTRAEELARHLASVDVDAVVSESVQLGKRARASTDPGAKKGFEEAQATREDELKTLQELRSAKERIAANLLHLVATLAALPTKVVHMRTLDAQAQDQLSGDMTAEIDAVSQELATSVEVMKSIGEIAR